MNFFLDKKFSNKMCLDFSNLSKDKNILHLDKKLGSYSQFQKPIVQGVQVVKFLFEVPKIGEIVKKSETISIIFKNPIFINEKIFFNIKKEKESFLLIGKNSFQKKIIIKFDQHISKNKDFEKNKFFDITKLIKNLVILTKYIGNYKNNLNLISTIEIIKSGNRKKKKFKRLSENFYKFDFQSQDMNIYAYFLTYEKKFKEKNNIKFKVKLNKKFLKNKKILIIGASSGLGKVLMNYFLLNNVTFDFTYNKNFETFRYLKEKYNIPRKRIFKLNQSILKKFGKKIKDYDIIYFFPTPKIFSFNEKFFDYERFNQFNIINIKFFLNIFDYFKNSKKKKFLYIPSSNLASGYENNAEYGFSKNLQEKILKKISKCFNNIKIINPRLESFLTASTKGLINNKSNYDKFIKTATGLE